MDERLLNRALLFTAKCFNESCHNHGKPVYLHSVKVAMKLMELGYNDKIVVGGILHDLIEDTDCTLEDIEREFGTDYAGLIEAVSFNPNIVDKFEQSKQMLDRAYSYGRDALIIKCIDMYENGKYYHLVTDPKTKDYLIRKYQYFTNLVSDILHDEPAYMTYLSVARDIK